MHFLAIKWANTIPLHKYLKPIYCQSKSLENFLDCGNYTRQLH